MKRVVGTFLVLALVSAVARAGGEPAASTDEVEEAIAVQVTGSRRPQPPERVPVSVTMLDQAFLHDLGARRTDDALLFVPGVQLGSGYGGTWDDYNIRGFRVWSGTTYRNGYLAGYSGQNATDAVNVERIEVVRGPASALWGAGLPGGTVNFVTKTPRADRFTWARLSLGTFDTERAEVDTTGPFDEAGRTRYRLTLAGDRSDGAREVDTFRRWLANPVVSHSIDEDTELLVEAQAYQQSYRPDPRGVPVLREDPLTLPDRRSYVEPDAPLAGIEGALGRVELERALTRRVRLKLGVQGMLGDYDEVTVLPLYLRADQRTLARAVINWESNSKELALQARVEGELEGGGLSHSWVAGADASTERVGWRVAATDPEAQPFDIDVFTPDLSRDVPTPVLPSGPENEWSYDVAALHASDLIHAGVVDATLALRVDALRQRSVTPSVDDEKSDVSLSSSSGLVVTPLSGAAAYANVSHGFWPVLGVSATGELLEPERSLGYELGTRLTPLARKLFLDVALFRIENRHVSVPDPTNPSFQVQRGAVTSQGIEAELVLRLGQLARARASYAYTDAVVSADPDPAQRGKRVPLVADHSAALWGDVSPFPEPIGGLYFAAGGVLTSERELLDGLTIPGYARLDAGMGHRAGVVTTRLRVENVLDQRYVLSGSDRFGVIVGAPRRFIASLELGL